MASRSTKKERSLCAPAEIGSVCEDASIRKGGGSSGYSAVM